MKFDWLANRVERLSDLQRQASVEDVVTTPGGTRTKETDILARDLQSLNVKIDAMMVNFHKQQLELAHLERRTQTTVTVGVALAATVAVLGAFFAGARRS